jgi:hypothetical protein
MRKVYNRSCSNKTHTHTHHRDCTLLCLVQGICARARLKRRAPACTDRSSCHKLWTVPAGTWQHRPAGSRRRRVRQPRGMQGGAPLPRARWRAQRPPSPGAACQVHTARAIRSERCFGGRNPSLQGMCSQLLCTGRRSNRPPRTCRAQAVWGFQKLDLAGRPSASPSCR